MAVEQRRSPRVPAALPVRWNRHQRTVEAVAADINEHGMFLRTSETTSPGTLLELDVVKPSGSIAMFGIARFVGATESGSGIGVEIYAISHAERRRWLEQYHSLLTTRP